MQKINLLFNRDGAENANGKNKKPVSQRQVRPSPQNVPPKPAPVVAASKQTKLAKPAPAPKQTKQTRQKKEPTTSALGVNLMTEEMLVGITQQNKLALLGLVALGSVVVVALLYFGLTLFQQRIVDQISEKEKRISAIDTELTPLAPKKQAAAAFQKNINNIIVLLNTHLYWTKFFSGLEKYTLPNVVFAGMNADQSGRLTLGAHTTDFASVARQLLAFEAADDFVKDVTITSATLSEATGGSVVSFSVTISLVEDVFFRDASGGPRYTE